MAKGQVRSNKEARKPKADKKAKAPAGPAPLGSGGAAAKDKKK